MATLSEHANLFLVIACLFGFFMSWGIGANDVANAMGTSVGSHAISIKQALIIAAVFEFLGASLAGGSVTDTIQKGIIDPTIPQLRDHPELLVYGMLSALLATASWLLIASNLGWPVSSTHTIVGSIIGFACVGISPKAVNWGQLSSVVGSWVITPIIAGCVAFVFFSSIQKFILSSKNPYKSAQRYIPFYVFFLGLVVSMVTTSDGLPHVGIQMTNTENVLIACGVGIVAAILSRFILMKSKEKEGKKGSNKIPFSKVERLFGYMMVFTACSMAFAHGSNDVANAVGPLAAIWAILQTGMITANTVLPLWILVLGGIGIVTGLATYGYKVIATVGKNITDLTPSRGFAAEISAAITVLMASGIGLPISTTQTLIGSIFGVGMARGIAALNLKVIATVFVSWVVTIPAGALISIVIFKIMVIIFGH